MPGLFDFGIPQAQPRPLAEAPNTDQLFVDTGQQPAPDFQTQLGNFVTSPEGQRALLTLSQKLNEPRQAGQSEGSAIINAFTGTALEGLQQKALGEERAKAEAEQARKAGLEERRVGATERQAQSGQDRLSQIRQQHKEGKAQREANLERTLAQTRQLSNPQERSKSDLQFATDAVREGHPELSEEEILVRANELTNLTEFTFEKRVQMKKFSILADKAKVLADPLLDDSDRAAIEIQYKAVLDEIDQVGSQSSAPQASTNQPKVEQITAEIGSAIMSDPALLLEANETFGEEALQAKLKELGLLPN